jgi:flagellar protein FlaG
MSEEAIGTTGQFPALNSTDFATSYHTSNIAPPQSVSATAAVQTVNQSSSAVSTPSETPSVAQSAAQTAATQTAKQPTSAEVSEAIAAANANLQSSDRTLDYRVDAATGISIATIRNSQTGVVVQQIPGADIIALARMLAGWAPGKHMLLDLIA